MNVPTSTEAKRIAMICRRRLTTPWSDREINCFRKLVKAKSFADPSDLDMMERYYEAERRKGDKGIHRRDLYTLIFNWPSELDRAKNWCESHPIKPTVRKIIPLPREAVLPAMSDAEKAQAAAEFKKLMGRDPTFL